MYIPKLFEESRTEVLDALLAAHPLATIVSRSGTGPEGGSLEANHIPLAARRNAEGQLILEGHVARANNLWKQAGQELLIVFQGPQTYISPAWYASKKEHGKVVPTWNYAVVHAHGTLQAHDDPQWLQRFLPRLTDSHESRVGSDWKMSDAPADFIDQLKEAIVGIEIQVTKIEGKWKVSQNRPPADRVTVKRALQQIDPVSGGLVP